MKLADATRIAEAIKAELAPQAERIEIAGSIRRGKADVGDIDLVILPRSTEALRTIKGRCARRCRVVADGNQNYIVSMRVAGGLEFQIDIFFAKHAQRELFETLPCNFGTLLLCRTGSKEHNIWLCQRAEQRKMKWNPYRGVFTAPDDTWIAGETEESVYEALGLKFIPPDQREPELLPR